MLMAEGFISAKSLSKKFFTLYFLCKDLLSKAAHYDWGLRAIKSVLVVAGDMLRKNNDAKLNNKKKITIRHKLRIIKYDVLKFIFT
jgi:dynein heavy chain